MVCGDKCKQTSIQSCFLSRHSLLHSLRAGFLIPYTLMPAGYKWLNRASPTTWILYGLGGSQLGDSQVPLLYNPAQPLTTVGQFMKTYFDYDYSFIWW